MTRKDAAVPATDLFSHDNLLRMDETVREVFGTMLGMEVASGPSHNACVRCGEHTAHIGFAGVISGHCEINLSRNASTAIASAMLGGTEVDAKSDAICDAVGELCNMLAGGWKDRLPCLSAACHITVPVRSCDLHAHPRDEEPAPRLEDLLVSHRSYTFGGQHLLQLTLAHARPSSGEASRH
jgi:chemotaxis protein CheX